MRDKKSCFTIVKHNLTGILMLSTPLHHTFEFTIYYICDIIKQIKAGDETTVKILIWFSVLLCNSVIVTIIKDSGIFTTTAQNDNEIILNATLMGLVYACFYGGAIWLASFLCKKWDKRKKHKKEKSNVADVSTELPIEQGRNVSATETPDNCNEEHLTEQTELDDHTPQQPSQSKNCCSKCGSILLDNQTFCPHCGKKVKNLKPKKQTNKIKNKKIIKAVIVILIVLTIILSLLGGLLAFIDKQKSYDFSTASYSLYRTTDNHSYVCEIKDAEGNILSEALYFDKNFYVKIICYGETVYIDEQGIYEYMGDKLVMKDDDGETTTYKAYGGCVFQEELIYTGNVPKKDTFSAEFKKEYLDTNETLTFKDDKTYTITFDLGSYDGKYERDGCIINGISADISGSHKWLVYEGHLIDRFFVNDTTAHTNRAKYEFYKYLQAVAPDEVGVFDRAFIRNYEKAHPITLK